MHNDMTGQKFNMLTIIEDNGGGVVKVRCDCGTVEIKRSEEAENTPASDRSKANL